MLKTRNEKRKDTAIEMNREKVRGIKSHLRSEKKSRALETDIFGF